MKIKEFREKYKTGTKCNAIYSTTFGTSCGTVLDSPMLVNKRYKVAIDSYQNLVPLADIASLTDTGEEW